jgi:hypothetical protein
MRRNVLGWFGATVLTLLAATPIFAHHSFSTVFDEKKPIAMTGTVTKLEWGNPHTWFYIDVKDDTGAVANWGMELAALNLLLRQGWTRTTLQVGDVVAVEGYASKNGTNIGNARVVTLTATGQKLVAGTTVGKTP